GCTARKAKHVDPHLLDHLVALAVALPVALDAGEFAVCHVEEIGEASVAVSGGMAEALGFVIINQTLTAGAMNGSVD
ncbi:hypothetical protein, partial [Salmonella enterica]|uniref:hypothetical protein n=2 Tax=Enterobacterales TaxID=91347 RepID=UPI001F08C118